MITNVTAYFNTGFNFTNIPYDRSVLTTSTIASTKKYFPECAVLQNKGLATLRIATMWNNIDGVDYVELSNGSNSVFYFVTDVSMLNDNCAQLSLLMDAVTTVGLNNIQIISGWCKRRHVKDDTLFSNVLPENFTPSSELVIDKTPILKPATLTEKDLNIIGATFNLLPADGFHKAQKYTVPDSLDDYVITPVCPDMDIKNPDGTPADYTIIDYRITSLASGHYKMPYTYLYDGDGLLIKENIDIIRTLGMENAITASYIIPKEFLTNVTRYGLNSENREYYLLASITPNYGELDTLLPFKVAYTKQIKNNKVYALWHVFTIISTCSGNSVQLKAEEVFPPATSKDTTFKLGFWADLSPNGCPYYAPFYFMGNTAIPIENCVKGMPWQNQPITYDRASGTAFDIVNRQIDLNSFATQEMSNDLALIRGNTQAGISAIKSAGGMLGADDASAFATAITTPAQLAYDMTNNKANYEISKQTLQQAKQRSQIEYNRRNNFRVPEITFPRDTSVQNYVGNFVIATRARLSEADAERFDNYLNAFGYAVDEPLTSEVFNCRQNFNYVQCSDLSVKTTESRYINEMIETQLTNGVRIWHIAPDPSKLYENNPIRS